MVALKRSASIGIVFRLLAGVLGLCSSSCTAQPLRGIGASSEASAQAAKLPVEIPIVIVKYFPVDGDRIDIKVTGDWGDTLAATRIKTERITQQTIAALEKGSRYHGYKDATAKPSLKYTILAIKEFLQPLPVQPKRPREKVPMTDYNRITADIDIERWIEQKGVKEVWVFGYHGGVLLTFA
jgi:hypothetical protein